MATNKREIEEDDGVVQKRPKLADESENGGGESGDEAPIKLQGSLISGELLFCGGSNWDLTGRKAVPKGAKNIGGRNIYEPQRIKSLMGVRVRTIISGCTACHSIIITTDGKAYSWGRNEFGQLGHGDKERRDVPTLIESLEDLNIVDAACGRNHSLVLSDEGHVYAFGENKMAQLGLGSQSPSVPSPTKIVHKGPQIRRVACGTEFSMMVDVSGNLFSFGSPEHGQLGHNSDGKYFITATKMGFQCETKPRRVQLMFEKSNGQMTPVRDVEIDDIACGANHTLALDRNGRVFTWGFGGYGRLGHNEPKDELVPRLIKIFDGPNRSASMIAAGSQFSMAVNKFGMLYMWGQNKPTGEATMYPKPVQDLNGWKVRSIGCGNRSIVVAADESLISWGPSPTYGELGYGADGSKSSTVAKEVKPVEDIYIQKVACGFGHTLLLAKCDTDEEKEKLDALEVFEP